MANSPISSSDARTAKLWKDLLLEDRTKEQFFGSQFMSGSGDNLIFTDSRLGSQKGDTVTIGMQARINKGWLGSGVRVDGNEYESTILTQSISVTDKQLGVKSQDRLSEQRAFYNMSEADRKSLIQVSAEAHDQDFFTALDSSNTATIYLEDSETKGTSTLATATEAVKASDLLAPDLFSQLYAMASTGFNYTQPRINPLKIDGQEMYVYLTHPDCLAGLENDSIFLQGQREAMERGKTNPIFTRAKSIWRNIIVMTHPNITIATNGSSVPYVRSHLLGANALVYVQAQMPEVEAKIVPYKNQERAWGYFEMSGVGKAQFNSKDFGAITVVTARKKYSDIVFA